MLGCWSWWALMRRSLSARSCRCRTATRVGHRHRDRRRPGLTGAGVSVTVRLAPLPPNTMFPLGSSVGLEELTDKVNAAADVSESHSKACGPLAVPWVVLLS